MSVTISSGTRKYALAAALAAATTAFSSASAVAQLTDEIFDEDQLGPVFTLSLGGKLYDDAWSVLELEPPGERNPAFPDRTAPVRDTWRCVSCHGWDYEGADGERGRVVPSVKAPSLAPLRGVDPAVVIEKLLEPSHPFPSDILADLALLILGAFISEGQYDRAAILDSNGKALGDPIAGRDTFEGACINCHQLDGRAFLRGEVGDRSSLGWVTRNRPEQALHKILNGVPVAEMLSLRFLPDRTIADLLAYIQAIDVNNR